jgi:glycosyltransferase involved in cell wall biosynthesis
VSAVKTVKIAYRVLSREGWKPLFILILERLLGDFHHVSHVKTVDALEVVFSPLPDHLTRPVTVTEGPVHIAWIMSPPGETSGGHHNLFRFIDFAEKAGHTCTIYFYSNHVKKVDVAAIRKMMATSNAFPRIRAEMLEYSREAGVSEITQAIFATGWETAYPAFLDKSHARRLYFVQDFEPYFYPVGSESSLAENTYRFGFEAITAGGWLAHKLSTDYGMKASHFDFGVEHNRYFRTNDNDRKEIFFYARPVTARRGFELGVMALEEFSKLRPDIEINLAGWDVSSRDLPFTFKNLGGVDISQLNEVYNRCAAGLVISMTNMSLLPLELMAAGVTPVVNDAPNNRMVTDSPFIHYVAPTPGDMARALVDVVDDSRASEKSRAMSLSLTQTTWERSGAQFVAEFERAMRG